jgi:hypothetical protein
MELFLDDTQLNSQSFKREKTNAEKDQLNIQLLSVAPIDREKVYRKMYMNRIMLIIEYMN